MTTLRESILALWDSEFRLFNIMLEKKGLNYIPQLSLNFTYDSIEDERSKREKISSLLGTDIKILEQYADYGRTRNNHSGQTYSIIDMPYLKIPAKEENLTIDEFINLVGFYPNLEIRFAITTSRDYENRSGSGLAKLVIRYGTSNLDNMRNKFIHLVQNILSPNENCSTYNQLNGETVIIYDISNSILEFIDENEEGLVNR